MRISAVDVLLLRDRLALSFNNCGVEIPRGVMPDASPIPRTLGSRRQEGLGLPEFV